MTYYDYHYKVNTRDTDPFNQCRPSAMLGLLQEAATEAAIALHVSREETLEKYHCFWMLARLWYRLDRPLHWDEALTVRTWHRGGRGASVYRDFDLFVGGVPVGEAVSTWVLADVDTHKLFRLSHVAEFAGSDGGALCKDHLLGKLRLPGNMELAERRRMHYSDADVNRHVNNSKYADFACDALELETLGAGHFVSSLQVGFLAECRPGETIDIYTGRGGETWYAHGCDGAGKSRFDAALTLAPAPETRS